VRRSESRCCRRPGRCRHGFSYLSAVNLRRRPRPVRPRDRAPPVLKFADFFLYAARPYGFAVIVNPTAGRPPSRRQHVGGGIFARGDRGPQSRDQGDPNAAITEVSSAAWTAARAKQETRTPAEPSCATNPDATVKRTGRTADSIRRASRGRSSQVAEKTSSFRSGRRKYDKIFDDPVHATPLMGV